jgi:hypothetical protein
MALPDFTTAQAEEFSLETNETGIIYFTDAESGKSAMAERVFCYFDFGRGR